MVEEHIAGRGVSHGPTLKAMLAVERHKFVPLDQIRYAYQDRPLPIGYGQTISQPYIVALMTETLEPRDDFRVLEIGTGSGYQAAVLARMVSQVYSIEIVEQLASQARERLAGQAKVKVITGDGYLGLPAAAPFDAIIVTAAAEHIPPPLISQLKEGGRMIIPVGSLFGTQWLTLVQKEAGGRVTSRRLIPVRFVPLTRR